MVSVGTIGHAQHNGSVHFWGTGVDPKRSVGDSTVSGYRRPPHTEFHVHALRGPYSRAAFVSEGISVPEIYGDPAWFLPRILPLNPEKTHELGVIVHISELDGLTSAARVKKSFVRYTGGEADGVRLISTFHEPTWGAFVDKLREILSCRRIVSTSFHGLIVPQAYGIPAIYFPHRWSGGRRLDIIADYAEIDHRIADFYAGAGVEQIEVFGAPYSAVTNWVQLMKHVDDVWAPLLVHENEFLDAFPLEKIHTLADSDWSLSPNLIECCLW